MFLCTRPFFWLLAASIILVSGCRTNGKTPTQLRDVGSPDGFAVDSLIVVDQDVLDTGLPLDMYTSDVDVVDMASVDATQSAYWQPSGEPDLVLNLEDLQSDIWFDEIYVSPLSCVYQEGCVDGTGVRRLVRFSTATGNAGETDYLLGNPDLLGDEVVYSPCHDHYHYTDYANYELRRGADIVRRGHKQAFCLMDIRPMSGVDPSSIRPRARYNCRYQGISAGWEDVYGSHLDCQWIDITDLEPGAYTLAVEINPQRVIKERTFTNNRGLVDVTVPSTDLTQRCPTAVPRGLKRFCDWEKRETVDCEPGRLLRVGGGGCYDLGSCTGSPVMRLCDADGLGCSASLALAESAEGCGESSCPHAETQCPQSGRVDVWVNLADSENDRIVVEADDGIVRLNEPCSGGRPRGLSRLCGWSDDVTHFTCVPGESYRVGCDLTSLGCDKDLRCAGDPILRVCEDTSRCTEIEAIAQSDDACGSRCPMTSFVCPSDGNVQVIKAAFDAGEEFSCNLTMVMQ